MTSFVQSTRSRFAASDEIAPQASGGSGDAGADARTFELLTATDQGDRPVLIRGGALVTGDAAIANHVGDVLVRAGEIAEVGGDLVASAPENAIVVDAAGMIVMPGLVDAHLHAWLGQMRGLAPAIDFMGYMGLTHGGLAQHYRPHDMYVGNLLTALTCLDAGVTTVLDNSHNARTPDHSNAAIEALVDAGIRAVHASGAPMAGEWAGQWPADVTRLRDDYCRSDDGLVTLRLFEAFPTVELWRFARDEGMWISTEMGGHVENLEELRAAGLLTAEHTFNHCFGISDRYWDLIADAGARVDVCPRSDASYGLGFGREPLAKALARGIRPGLSMDNETSYGADMFVEMQNLLMQQRGRTFESALAEDPDVPDQLSLAEVLEFATLRGAESCNLQDRVGSLTPGKRADIVLVRTTDLATFPLTNALATLVGFASRANVDTVFVDGRVRKWRGRLVGHDVARLRALVEASRDRLLEAYGLPLDVFAEEPPTPLTPWEW